MIFLNQLDQISIDGRTAVMIGKFDGLHKGHQLLLKNVLKEKQNGLLSCVVTFDFSAYDGIPKKGLITAEAMTELLKEAGVDYYVRLPFTDEFASMRAEDFICHVLVEKLHVQKIYCGPDFRFGRGRRGSTDMLKAFGSEQGFDVTILDKTAAFGTEISSSVIRSYLTEGKIRQANEALGRPYTISGTVIHGRFLATEFGYPTINIVPEADLFLPRFGVYYVRVLMDGRWYDGMANIGVKPTVTDDDVALLETYLLDTSGNFYDKFTRTEFVEFVRPERKFESLKALERQIADDLLKVREFSVKYAKKY